MEIGFISYEKVWNKFGKIKNLMKCPACLMNMECKSEIHQISHSKKRMDFYCYYDKCPTNFIHNQSFYYGPFAQIITDDPNPWKCSKYGFIVINNNQLILLTGQIGNNKTLIKVIDNTLIYKIPYWKEIMRTNYIQFSTGDDMHLEVIEYIEKFIKLRVFW